MLFTYSYLHIRISFKLLRILSESILTSAPIPKSLGVSSAQLPMNSSLFSTSNAWVVSYYPPFVRWTQNVWFMRLLPVINKRYHEKLLRFLKIYWRSSFFHYKSVVSSFNAVHSKNALLLCIISFLYCVKKIRGSYVL